MFGLIATLSFVVVGAQSQDSFSHDFALKRMLPLAAAAYSDNPGECVGRLDGNVVKFYKTDCSGPLGRFAIGKAYCSAYTALLNKEKAIVLSFRGTDSRLQLVKEFFHPLLDKKWFGDSSVNTYFLNAFHSLFTTRTNDLDRSMFEDVRDLIRTHSGYDIWITGHSLGGALASLVASYLVESGNAEMSRIKLMTFGQPRTGDQKFAESVNKMNYAFRVIHDNDLVPQVPPKKFGYTHHKKEESTSE
ncbi:unnamed protein product [Cylicocyclus nassatus]|uniref:Fungal lipase-type domain-containing protein n=1 Tax=Cylicocyclus nassatus TaxID=53992 RepID=A0AA36GQU9_CYLNA|nr:unnamed protein product [Cylicocyclus nassatus]